MLLSVDQSSYLEPPKKYQRARRVTIWSNRSKPISSDSKHLVNNIIHAISYTTFLVGKIRKETIKPAELDGINDQENKLMDSIKKLNKVSLTSVNREPTRSPKFPKEDDQNYSLAQLCLYCSLPINHVISVAVGCSSKVQIKFTFKSFLTPTDTR